MSRASIAASSSVFVLVLLLALELNPVALPIGDLGVAGESPLGRGGRAASLGAAGAACLPGLLSASGFAWVPGLPAQADERAPRNLSEDLPLPARGDGDAAPDAGDDEPRKWFHSWSSSAGVENWRGGSSAAALLGLGLRDIRLCGLAGGSVRRGLLELLERYSFPAAKSGCPCQASAAALEAWTQASTGAAAGAECRPRLAAPSVASPGLCTKPRSCMALLARST